MDGEGLLVALAVVGGELHLDGIGHRGPGIAPEGGREVGEVEGSGGPAQLGQGDSCRGKGLFLFVRHGGEPILAVQGTEVLIVERHTELNVLYR